MGSFIIAQDSLLETLTGICHLLQTATDKICYILRLKAYPDKKIIGTGVIPFL